MTHQKWEFFKMKSVQRKPFLPLKRLKVPLGSLEFWWNGLSAWYVCACCSGSHLARVVMMFADCLVVMEPWDVYPPGWEKIKMIFKHTFDGDMLASLGGYIYIIIYIHTNTVTIFVLTTLRDTTLLEKTLRNCWVLPNASLWAIAWNTWMAMNIATMSGALGKVEHGSNGQGW